MHILFLTHYFPPEVNAPATRTLEHCRRWVDAGHQVTVITGAPNCPTGVVFDGYRNTWRSEEEVEGIRVIRVWTYLSANKGFLSRILNFTSYMLRAVLCALTLRGIDVVVATSPQFFCGWAGVFCKWVRRWPFVLEIRDLWPESIVAVGAMKQSRAIRLLEWLEHRMYRAADHIVTVGDGYRQGLLERGVPDDKISVIPNGVNLSQFEPQPQSADLRNRWQGAGKFVCSYIGTVGMAHGLEVILDAAEKLERSGRTDVVFWIVGDGAERQRLQDDAAARGIRNVTFTGMVSKDEIPLAVASCDACLVHLRGTELFGTVIPSKIFEIMALNIPIIMAVRGQAQEIVIDADAGVSMTPDDADSLIAAIEVIERQPQRYRSAREYVATHFNRDDLAAQMLTAIEQTADVPNSTPAQQPTEVEPTRNKQAA